MIATFAPGLVLRTLLIKVAVRRHRLPVDRYDLVAVLETGLLRGALLRITGTTVLGRGCGRATVDVHVGRRLDRVAGDLGSGRVGHAHERDAIQSSTNPMMKWVTEPAAITIVRFHTGNRHMARSSSPGSTSSSCGVMPTILTNPPSGIALTPYSVSPLVERPESRTETGEIPGYLHAEGLGRHHVTGLMQADRDQDDQGEQYDAQSLHYDPSVTAATSDAGMRI